MRRRAGRRRAGQRLLASALVCTLWAGCGLNMEKNYRRLRPNLTAHRYAAALADIEAEEHGFYGGRNRLLYLMDRAMVLYLDGRHKDSSAALEEAKALAQKLWTQSLREEVAGAVTTDNQVAYQGEDFEKVMLHLLRALNDLAEHNLAEARVEARQMVARLALYNAKYQDHPNSYSDDGFARWLAARVTETDPDLGAANDAWIDYRRALSVYRRDGPRYRTAVPRLLVADAQRVVARLGADFAAERRALAAEFGVAPLLPGAASAGPTPATVVFLHLNGEAPYKVDDTLTIFLGLEPLRIAVPKFVPKTPYVMGARLRAPALGVEVATEKAADLTAIAMENLADHMERIRARAIVRATTKYAAGTAAQLVGRREGGRGGALLELGGALWNIGNAIAEEADKRSWVTLPAEIGICAMLLPPGHHRLEVDFVARGGAVVERTAQEVDLAAGQTHFASYRTFF